MKNVPTSGTRPEQNLDKLLRRFGYNDFVSNWPIMLPCRVYPIVPDKVFLKSKVACYVHGEFWHRPSAKKTRKRRIQKDNANVQCLQKNGWIVLEFMGKDLELAIGHLMNKKFKDEERARSAKKVFNEIKAAIDEALKGK